MKERDTEAASWGCELLPACPSLLDLSPLGFARKKHLPAQSLKVVLASRRPRRENYKFKASLSYKLRPSLQNKQKSCAQKNERQAIVPLLWCSHTSSGRLWASISPDDALCLGISECVSPSPLYRSFFWFFETGFAFSV